ncbi:MAG TPA: hypothetical protein DD429_12305 [Clostridiaceae bacterium]|nr:hypothetical protein [Clostridiaceae bacterium]
MTAKALELYATQMFIDGYPNGRQANYRYMLLEEEKEIEYFNQKITVPCYGVEIIREDLDQDDIYSIEKNSIEYMTTYKYKVVQLIKKLYDNCVSPLHLIDIAGSLADEWVCDFDEILNDIQAQ